MVNKVAAEVQTAQCDVELWDWQQMVFYHAWPATFTAKVVGDKLVLGYTYPVSGAGEGRSLARVVHTDQLGGDLGGRLVAPILSPDGPLRDRAVLISSECLREPVGEAATYGKPVNKAAAEAAALTQFAVRKGRVPEGAQEGVPSGLKGKRGRNPKYPFAAMEVGDSFEIPPGPGQPQLATVRVLCSTKNRMMTGRFLCRPLASGAIEVWRES